MFSGCTGLPDSEETELGSSNQEASSSTGKNTRVVLEPCSHMEVHPYSFFQWCGYVVPGCHLLGQFSVRIAKISSRIGFS